MGKILAIGTSNSSESINLKTMKKLKNVEVLDIKDFNAPIYSMQLEQIAGIPKVISQFIKQLKDYEVLIFAVPEYNGNVPAYFKNILDWCTREDFKFLEGKKIILSTTTPGARGGSSVRQILATSLPFFGATVIGSFGISNYAAEYNWTENLQELQACINEL